MFVRVSDCLSVAKMHTQKRDFLKKQFRDILTTYLKSYKLMGKSYKLMGF